MDAGDTRPVVLLSQPVRNGPHGEFRGAIDGRRRHDLECTDRGYVDDVARAAFRHLGKDGSHAVKNALDVDIDHAVPFVDLHRGHG
ncbi:hypothetical protein D3C87_1488460 [compost metagenome]